MIGHPETERIDPYDKDVERDSGRVYGAGKIKHALGQGAWRSPGAASTGS